MQETAPVGSVWIWVNTKLSSVYRVAEYNEDMGKVTIEVLAPDTGGYETAGQMRDFPLAWWNTVVGNPANIRKADPLEVLATSEVPDG